MCSNAAVKLKFKILERTKGVRIKFQDTSNAKLSEDNNTTLSVRPEQDLFNLVNNQTNSFESVY